MAQSDRSRYGEVPVYRKVPRRMMHAVPEEPLEDPVEPDVSCETLEPVLTLPRPQVARRVVLANQKGGVGKTTTAVNIAVSLAHAGLKVLVCDLDPQGNATTALGIDHNTSETTGTYEVLVEGQNINEHLRESPHSENLKCLAATLDLAGAELELVSITGREVRLKNAIARLDEEFDYIFFDCPPSLGLLTLNALVAANEIMVPIQCEYYALEGLTALLRTISMAQQQLNPSLKVSTVLLTMFDGRTNLSHEVAREVREYFPKETLDAVIPRSVRVSEAPSYGETVVTYDPNSAGARAYRAAAAEMAMRTERTK